VSRLPRRLSRSQRLVLDALDEAQEPGDEVVEHDLRLAAEYTDGLVAATLERERQAIDDDDPGVVPAGLAVELGA